MSAIRPSFEMGHGHSEWRARQVVHDHHGEAQAIDDDVVNLVVEGPLPIRSRPPADSGQPHEPIGVGARVGVHRTARDHARCTWPSPAADPLTRNLQVVTICEVTGKEMVALLKRNEWVLDRVSGSHHKFIKGGQHVVVPVHGKRDLKKGVENTILKKAGLE